MCASSHRPGANRLKARHGCFLACGLALFTAAPAGAETIVPVPVATAGKPVALTAPLLDGSLYLGDVPVTIRAGNGGIEVPTARLLDLLATVLDETVVKALRGALGDKPSVAPGMLGSSGVTLCYSAETVAM